MKTTAVRIATAAIAATGLLAAGAVAAVAATSASIPSSDGTITGCYSTATTSLRAFFLIDRQSGATCPRGFTEISFSQRGPAGATGAAGPKGDVGPAGATGPAGTPGADGPPSRAYIEGLADMYIAEERFAVHYGGAAGASFVRDALRAWTAREL